MIMPNEDAARVRADLTAIWRAAVAAVEPGALVRAALSGGLAECAAVPSIVAGAPRIFILAVGKAALPMAAAARAALEGRVARTLAVATTPAPQAKVLLPGAEICLASHPVPDRSSLAAAQATVALLGELRTEDLLLLLLSGGASALLTAPAPGISLEDKIAVTQGLLRARATIKEINAVRKHLSYLKGGRLLAHCHDARVLGLILSDVQGNDLTTIGSGLTAADPSTFSTARGVLIRHGLWGRAPEPVRELLEAGQAGEVPETIKPGDPLLARVDNFIIGDNARALAGAAQAAVARGYNVTQWEEMRGEACELGKSAAVRLRDIASARQCILAGGEPVVTVRGGGRGGRAQEMALALAIELARDAAPRVSALCAGTDGIDGPTDAAGGFADSGTVARARAAGLDAQGELARNNSYPVLEAAGDLFRTGPTGTNVADIFVALVNY
jgi:glycerate 2-kinase